MLRTALIASALAAMTIASVSAAEPPANAEQCHRLHTEIAEIVSKAAVPADAKIKVDELLAALKGHCDASAFTDAVRTAEVIRDTAGIRK